MIRYLQGWRKCPTHFDVQTRRGLYPPSQKLCKDPSHRRAGFDETDTATVPLEDDEREELLTRLLGDELYGVIESGDPDSIKDAVAEALVRRGDVVRQEIREFPEFEVRPNAAANGNEMLAWVPAE